MGFLSAIEKQRARPPVETSQEKRPPIKPQEPRKREDPCPNTPPIEKVKIEDASILENMTLGDLGRSNYTLTLWSEVMGDTILLTHDNYTPAPGDPVTYTAHELAHLLRYIGENLKAAHAVKKVLGGRFRCMVEPEEKKKEEET